MARKADGRFKAYIEKQEANPSLLPLVHTTSAYSFRDMCEDDTIDPKMCRHFNEELIYLFYGRPAYRTEKAEFTDLEFNWPIVFIFDPRVVDGIKRVFPFDTGAFCLNLYNRFFAKNAQMEDFELPGSLDYATKVIQAFYTSDNEYLRGKSQKNVEIPPFDFEVQGIQKLAQEPALSSRISEDQKTRDERSSAIEVQVGASINIKEATLDILMPQRYLDMCEVVEALGRWGLAEENVHYYEVMGFHDQGGWLPQIYKLVMDIYKKRGFLEG